MSKKILLADDSITIQKVVELTFSDGDYEVIATSNGTRAIEEIPRVKPDIILSDIIMPEKNGYELCEWVKSHPEYRHIPVILLTGTFEPFDPDRAEKAGCDAVVTKPFESQSLIQKVEELISRTKDDQTASGGSSDEPFAVGDERGDEPAVPPFSPPQQPEKPEPIAANPPEMNAPPPPPPLQQSPSFEMGQPDFGESAPFEGSESASVQPEESSTHFPKEEEEPKPQGDIFGEQASPSAEDDEAATRMIPRMSMEDIERIRSEQQDQPDDTAEVEPSSPFGGDSSPMETGGETEETMESPQIASPSFDDEPESSPFDAPAEDSSIEDDATRMIPKMSMEDIQRLQQQEEGDEAPSDSASSPFGEEAKPEADEEESPFASEPTADTPSPFPAPGDVDQEETGQQSATEEFDDSSTRMIPKMAFDDIQRLQQESEEAEQSEAAPEQPESAFGMGLPAPADDSAAANPFAAEAEAESEAEESFAASEEQASPFSDEEETAASVEEEPVHSGEQEPGSLEEQEQPQLSDEEDPGVAFGGDEPPAPFAEEAPELLPPPPHPPEEPVMQEPEPEATAGTARADEPATSGALSEEQIDTIARRVVELLSDKVIREIAWDVIPETAEMIVRERIRELEGEE